MFFRELEAPRGFHFGMKVTQSEFIWLRNKARQEGITKSALVRKWLAYVANKEGNDAGTKRG